MSVLGRCDFGLEGIFYKDQIYAIQHINDPTSAGPDMDIERLRLMKLEQRRKRNFDVYLKVVEKTGWPINLLCNNLPFILEKIIHK